MSKGNGGNEEETTHKEEANQPVVLLVEDERGLAELYTRFLEDIYTVRTAYTGDEALELLDEAVDVALLDRRLETWSGDQLLSVIQDRKLDCQVALVTAIAPDFDVADLAIDEYLEKPISREDLLELVEELLLRSDSDITQQELLALISRKISIENEKSTPELEGSDEYARLKRRIEIAKQRLNLDLEQVGANKHRPDACPRCDLRWDLSVGDTIGFLNLGSYVWKCTGCGSVVKVPDPSSRRVARR
ncbi:response regulator (plasmid) [Halorarum halophilum]|uniref:Response regulator n=1 Tax=Halorarum halophilum TaxID=2743090 RepID=A0A7D5KW57_9EURY|nr:response regulator [Halobaculum halophilum]QLG29880.1 response regulator [Halobaculum halophilum]